jgi:DNA recombination protein RmuC
MRTFEHMELLPILVVLALGLVCGFVILFMLLRQFLISQSAATNEQAVEAAVRATLTERGATVDAVGRDREATMHAAVIRAAEVADQKLGASLRSGTEQMDARLRSGTEQMDARLRQGAEKLQANMALGHQKYDASASIIEKQNVEMRTELKRVEKMLTELQEKTAGQHGAVVAQLQEAAKVTGMLQQTTGSLRDALGSSKKRGNWGERMAQDVLSHAGMVEGINYRVQKGIESGGRPDFTILMPRQMVLHMDVKFPADNYLAFLEARETSAIEAEGFRKQFVKDARNRVKELATRNYHEENDSVDTVVLFIPNESIFAFLQENSPELMDEAMRAKIVLCGPSTLIAVLQVVRQAMDNFMLEQRSNEIMDCLSGFKNEWTKFSDQVSKHEKHLNTAMNSFAELSGARTNQLQRQLNKIDEIQVSDDQVSDDQVIGDTAEVSIEAVEIVGQAADGRLAGLEEWPQLREVATA